MDFKEIENKWQKYWEEHPDIYHAEDKSDKPKKYVLVEFPYPSGSGLHMGHAFSYTGADVYARFRRMQGDNVMFPMGWDAFGLPTENHAIKTKQKPQVVTKKNTEAYKEEMKRLAFSFDWTREVNTTDSSYYKWTQWIFIKLFEKGLAYKQEMPINWCPSCKTGLANEEVIDGKCERCHAEVSRRNISQWVVKITDYADRLAQGLKDTAFIDKVKQAQINWIGKSEGAKIRFKIVDDRSSIKELEVFTTRPDTLYGATFMVISPEHQLAIELSESNKEIKQYQELARRKSDMERTELNKEKTGVFSGLYAINPVDNKEIPIWISDFVLVSYGTGAIMSVPAHDDRDKEFAEKYNLPIISVYGGDEKTINSELWNGLSKEEAIKKSIEFIKEKGIGEATSNYHLRDWIFSRQHYWGEPIPMIFCENCARHGGQGWVTEKEENLPIRLPEVEAYEPTDDGLSPLSRIESFVNCQCPRCGEEAKRETDTMPNWAGSDWYFLRYCDPKNDVLLASQEKLKQWLPVNVYVGGDEHNTLHLLYSRFIHQFLYDLGVVPTPEPYYKRLSHGVILGSDNTRMSKSRGNVIVPETVADKYGVDVVRMYLMFMGPFDGTMAWNEKTLMGVKRFLDRFDKFMEKTIASASKDEVKTIINRLVRDVANELDNFKFNTAVAKLMEALNQLKITNYELRIEEIQTLIKLIAPLAPYTAEEWWSKLGGQQSVHQSLWPMTDKKYLVDEKIMIVVSINGKVRDKLTVNSEQISDREEVLKMAKGIEKISKLLEGKTIIKEIYVVGKMVNLVI